MTYNIQKITTEKKTRLLYCHNSLLSAGGMERVLTTKANYLAEKEGYEVHICIRGKQEKPFFPLSSLVSLHFLNAISHTDYQKKLKQLICDVKPDYTISLFGEESDFLFKMNDGSKKILEFHFCRHYLQHLVSGIRNLRFRILHKLKASLIQFKHSNLVKKYDKVVVLTQNDLKLWNNPSNMIAIPNPLSFQSNQVSSLDHKRIIAMGRFTAQKGFDLLIEAFNLIAKKHSDWELYIYGEGQDEELLKDMIRNHALEKQIYLLPPTHNVHETMLMGDIFLFPSRYEGFGLVLTEAMECGLACISFDCECGPSEIIEDGKSGFLVPVGDIKTLSKKIELIIENPALLRDLAKEAKIRVQLFKADYIMKKWATFFS